MKQWILKPSDRQRLSSRTNHVTALGQTVSQLSALGQTVLQLSDRAVIQLHVTAQFYLENKRKIHPRGLRACRPKRCEEKRESPSPVAPLFICFSPAPGPPSVNWASQECCLFYLRSSLQFLDLPLFSFRKLFPSLSSSHHHSELLFPNYLTKPTEYYHVPPEIYITY